ncbi:MAG: hypothetical protein PVH19_13570 [Planctomycetia bacterium]|jgi:hypothetical protein
MTTIEHAMLGIDGVLAVGLNRRWGWSLCAMAGVVAIVPDWDGLTLLGSASLFDAAHRVWGHAGGTPWWSVFPWRRSSRCWIIATTS